MPTAPPDSPTGLPTLRGLPATLHHSRPPGLAATLPLPASLGFTAPGPSQEWTPTGPVLQDELTSLNTMSSKSTHMSGSPSFLVMAEYHPGAWRDHIWFVSSSVSGHPATMTSVHE